MQGCCIYVALLKIEPGTPLILPLQPAILSQIRTTKGADLWAAVTLPTHYRNVFAELGYAQAEIDARRYYDNCLYFFALLALSGRYRIWPL